MTYQVRGKVALMQCAVGANLRCSRASSASQRLGSGVLMMSETAIKIFTVLKARPVLFTILAVIIAVETLNLNGFCYQKGRFLSSQEFIEKAVTYNLQWHGKDTIA